MKKSTFTSVLFVALATFILSFSTVNAQEWNHGKKGIYSAGIGGTEGIYIVHTDFGDYHGVSNAGLSLNFSGEYKVHQYVGVGFQTGLHFFFSNLTSSAAIEIPLIVKANFHIMELTKASIKNKLDVYAGFQFGGGPAFYTGDTGGGNSVYGVIHVGPQVGVRYWVTQKIAVFGEFGWGATFANAGVTF